MTCDRSLQWTRGSDAPPSGLCLCCLSSPKTCVDLTLTSSPSEVAIFTRTMRGKDQVNYHGQPFILERDIKLKNGVMKRVWRCNQWWSGKCRARIFTMGIYVWTLRSDHTHEGVITRKKRLCRAKAAPLVGAAAEAVYVPDVDNEIMIGMGGDGASV